MECYIIHTSYEEFKLAKTLKEAILIRRANYDNAASAYKSSAIDFENENGDRENIDLRPYIKQIELTPEKLKEIDDLVEQEIKKTEQFLSTIKSTITGYFGITRDRKEWAVQNEIKNASYVWDEEKINSLPD